MRRWLTAAAMTFALAIGGLGLAVAQEGQDAEEPGGAGGCATPAASPGASPIASPLAAADATPAATDCGTPEVGTPAA